jgi:hypothetical protein
MMTRHGEVSEIIRASSAAVFALVHEPVMGRVFRWETRKRLRALRDHFANLAR